MTGKAPPRSGRVDGSRAARRSGEPTRPAPARPAPETLQQAAGNHATARLLRGTDPADVLPPSVTRVLRGGGQPLDPALRVAMQTRFDHDFGNVRVHTNSQAAQSAEAVNANAYTVGHHVVFGPGRFAPHSPAGERLLMHELAHVVQQSRGGPPPALDTSALHERDARAAADTASRNARIRVRSGTGVGLARDDKGKGKATARRVIEILVLTDEDSIQLQLEDGTYVPARVIYNGHMNPGSYQVVVQGNKIIPIDPATAQRAGGTPSPTTHNLLTWSDPAGVSLPEGSVITVDVVESSPEYETVVTGTKPEPGGGGSHGGQPAPKPATAPGAGAGQKKGVKTGAAPPPTKTGGTAPPRPERTPPGTGTKGTDALKELQALPESLKALLGGESSFTPENADQLLRIAQKLQQLSQEELDLYKQLAAKLTHDLDAFERSIDVYMQVKEQIRRQIEAQKKAEAKEPTLDQQLEQTWKAFDESKFGTMSADQKEALARQIAAEQAKIQLEHMVTHPGETAVGMVKSLNPVEAAKGIAEDLKEAANGDESGFARAAAAAGALGKSSGYVSAVCGVLYVALLFVPGVDVAVLAATALAAGATALVASQLESELRIQAARRAKTPEEFKSNTEKAAAAMANVVAQAAMLALHLAAKLVAKIPLGERLGTVGDALGKARASALKLTGVGPALDAVRSQLLTRLRAASAGLPEALAKEKAGLAATAGRVKGMTGEQLLEKLAEGDGPLQEATGISPDEAKQWKAIADTPQGKQLADKLKTNLERAMTDAPARAQGTLDQYQKAIDQTADAVQKAKTPDDLRAAIDAGQKATSPDELARQTQAAGQAYVKERVEAELPQAAAGAAPPTEGQPAGATAPPATAKKPPVVHEPAKAPAPPPRETPRPAPTRPPETPDVAGKQGETTQGTPGETETAPASPERAALEKQMADLKSQLAAQQEELAKVSARRKELESEVRAATKEMQEGTSQSKKSGDEGWKKAVAAKNRRQVALDELETLPDQSDLTKEIDRTRAEIKRTDVKLNPKTHRAALPCFSPDTPVWTPEGPRRIDCLQPGDVVLSYDLDRRQRTERTVLQVHQNRTQHFYDIALGDTVIRATGLHRFWVEDLATWIPARDLRPGAQITSMSGSPARVISITRHDGLNTESYNLTIAGTHTYFVGSGVLAHNEGAVDIGLGGDLIVYRGTNPKFPGKVYVGQTGEVTAGGKSRGIKARQKEHREYAAKQLEKNRKGEIKLSDEDVKFYEFMEDVTLEEVVTGIATDDQADYLEQRNMDVERDDLGNDLMNRREQIASPKHEQEVTERILQDKKVRDAGYCP